MDRYLIGDSSEILVGRGWTDTLLPASDQRRRVALLVQDDAAAVADQLEALLRSQELTTFRFPLADGEAAKELGAVGEVYEQLARSGITRHDTIVGVGGGAATDAAGFVAATWMRGVESVLIPTTLLGAVDAAIGGKTAINVAGKNLVGAFWLPSRVIVNLDVLEALPTPLLVEGAAEAFKVGLLGPTGIVQAYENHGIGAPLESVVGPAIAYKAGLVDTDLRETGERALLNLGHTIGHAIEFASGLSHGHSVSIGLHAALAISEKRSGFGQKQRVLTTLDDLGLPTIAPDVDGQQVRELIRLDKKSDGEGLRMVLLTEIGSPTIEYVDDDLIEVGLAAIGL